MLKDGKYQYIPFFITVGVILTIDLFGVYKPIKGEGLLIGVLAGMIASIISILHGNLKNSYYFHKENHQHGDTLKIHLSQEVSFLNKASIKATLNHIPENSNLIIDASDTRYIDFDVLELIKEFRDIKAPLKNINCKTQNFKEVYNIENSYNISSSH